MAALRKRAKFLCQERDCFPASRIKLISRWPMQRLLGERAQIAGIKSAPPKCLDDRNSVMMVVFGHKIDIGGDQCAQVIAKSDIGRWTVIERTNANGEHVLCGFRRLPAEPIG